MTTVSPAIDVITEGLPRAGVDAHRRWHTRNAKGDITANEQRPACMNLPDVDGLDEHDATLLIDTWRKQWRSFAAGFAVDERGATPCTAEACFGGAA